MVSQRTIHWLSIHRNHSLHVILWNSSSSRKVNGWCDGKPICTASIFFAAVNTAFDNCPRARILASKSVGSSKCNSRQVSRAARRFKVVGGLFAASSTLWVLRLGEENREHGELDSRRAAEIVFVLWRHAFLRVSAISMRLK